MDNKQIIEKIMEEVQATELRDKLLRVITEQQPAPPEYNNILTGIGLKPDAVTKNIGLAKQMNIGGCIFFVCLGAAMITWGDDLFGWLFILMSGFIYFLKQKFYDNLAD